MADNRRVQWEYTRLDCAGWTDRVLNDLGAQGWEMVGIVNMMPSTMFYMFKRKKWPEDNWGTDW